MSLTPLFAEAAGLGKLTVLSGLGQPLRAELDIGATKDELAGMSARLAPQDVFRQAGVDFASVLLDLRFAVEKRPGGNAVAGLYSCAVVYVCCHSANLTGMLITGLTTGNR
jgi:pilus assembly protein FimV